MSIVIVCVKLDLFIIKLLYSQQNWLNDSSFFLTTPQLSSEPAVTTQMLRGSCGASINKAKQDNSHNKLSKKECGQIFKPMKKHFVSVSLIL